MSNSTTKTPRFIPLNEDSQGSTDNVLYYDSHASLEAFYETSTARLMAVYKLHEAMYEYHNPLPCALSAVSSVSTLLLSDVISLIEKFSPASLALALTEKPIAPLELKEGKPLD